MRNRIPCSAERLSLLDPEMIQSVVEPPAFAWGSQYLTENRVRIVKANAVRIVSTVIGSGGLYEQTVELKNGMLTTWCTCNSKEQPTCRHCIAVLLEYNRWSNPLSPEPSPSEESQPGVGAELGGATAATDVNLLDLAAFVAWLRLAVSALSAGHPAPELPVLASRQIQEWGQRIKDLDRRCREAEATKGALETDLHAREGQINRLTEQLQTLTQDLKAAQESAEANQRQIVQYRRTLEKVRDAAKELEQVAAQSQGLAANIATQKSQLDHLSTVLKKSADSL